MLDVCSFLLLAPTGTKVMTGCSLLHAELPMFSHTGQFLLSDRAKTCGGPCLGSVLVMP